MHIGKLTYYSDTGKLLHEGKNCLSVEPYQPADIIGVYIKLTPPQLLEITNEIKKYV